MDPVTGALVVGGILKGIGLFKANADAAAAKRANAQALLMERDLLLESLAREEGVLESEKAQVLSAMESRAAKNGIALTGSTLDNMANAAFRASEELYDLRKTYHAKAKLLGFKAQNGLDSADSTDGFFNQALTLGTTALDTYASYKKIS